MQKRDFISKVIHMSFSMMIFNISQTLFGMYISQKTGAACVGLFHLIMSIYSVSLTLVTGGMGLTVTRIISDTPKPYAKEASHKAVCKCIGICIVACVIVGGILISFSGYISEHILKIPHTENSLKMLALLLPSESISAILCGSFTAFGYVGCMSFGRFTKEAFIWCVTVVMIKNGDFQKKYEVIIIAECISSYAQCICDIIMYKKTNYNFSKSKVKITYKKIFSLCAPLAIGSYLRAGLVSGENILVPYFLAESQSLSPIEKYGIIKGMSIPVMMIAYVFVVSFTAMIVPEMARRKSSGQINSIKYISSLSIEYIMELSFLISGFLFIYHDDICMMLYKSKHAGHYLGYLSFLPIFMMTDTVTDAILKGLDRQVASLKINIVDSAARIAFIAVLLPIYDIYGYIAIMYISEILNLSVSYYILKKETALKFPLKSAIIVPIFALCIAYMLTDAIGKNSFGASVSLFCAGYVIAVTALKGFFKVSGG